MISLSITVNGRNVCLAGVGEDGVLNAIVGWASRKGVKGDLYLHIGGLDCSAGDDGEHLKWKSPSIRVGSEIAIKVVDSLKADKPYKRKRYKRKSPFVECRQVLRQYAKPLTKKELNKLVSDLKKQIEEKLEQ